MSKRLLLVGLLVLTFALALAGCQQREPRPLANRPTNTPAPATVTPTPRPTRPKPTAAPQTVSSTGAHVWQTAGCHICHGDQAQGNIGPALAHTDLTAADLVYTVRNATPPMPVFGPDEVDDASLMTIYAWLQSLPPATKETRTSGPVIVKVEPGQTELPEGSILGMSIWTGLGCESCHGVFAQGSKETPLPLAGISDPPEVVLENMRKTADEIPEHAADYTTDPIFERLYHWLQSGADPEGGC